MADLRYKKLHQNACLCWLSIPKKDRSEIVGMLSYTDETICAALALLIEMDLIGYKSNKSEETEEKHEKK